MGNQPNREKAELNMKNGFLSEFKTFITRGNVIDLAVGVIIGGAFTTIVNSLVKDIVMPFIGMIFGGVSFTHLKYVITPATDDVAEAAIYYGNFIQNIVSFVLVAFVVFIMVKVINNLHKKEEVAAPAPVTPANILLLQEIRDLLKK